jgi:hypothetical protein
MATGAVFSFLGFPGWAPLHLWLPDDGDPAAAALVLSAAAADSRAAAVGAVGLLGGFLRCVHQGEPVASPVLCAGCVYRYLIVYRQSGAWPLRISAWRREQHGPGWRRCCEPMPLESFLRRFRPRRPRRAPELLGAGLA